MTVSEPLVRLEPVAAHLVRLVVAALRRRLFGLTTAGGDLHPHDVDLVRVGPLHLQRRAAVGQWHGLVAAPQHVAVPEPDRLLAQRAHPPAARAILQRAVETADARIVGTDADVDLGPVAAEPHHHPLDGADDEATFGFEHT